MLDVEGTWDNKVKSKENGNDNISQPKTGTCSYPKLRCKLEFQSKESESII